MKKTYLTSLAALLLASCGVEAPFGEKELPTGTIHKAALSMDIKFEGLLTRADAPDIRDCKVDIIPSGSTQPTHSYVYGSMPEIVEITAGDYRVMATHGDDALQGWEAPYYKGCSKSFTVSASKPVTNIEPITCRLANVKVETEFDTSFGNAENLQAEVSVVNGSSLVFKKGETRAGYFGQLPTTDEGEHDGAGLTLFAKVSGIVDGRTLEVETMTLENVKAGFGYKLIFRMQRPNAAGNGQLVLGDESSPVNVNAQVNVTDLSEGQTAEPDDNEYLDDDIIIGGYEEEEPVPDDPGTEDPGTEDPGGDNPADPASKKAEITINEPLTLDPSGNVVTEGMKCILTVKSFAEGGIQTFDVTIDSETLTSDILTDVGLSTQLNIAETPTKLVGPLEDLPLPVNVKGRSEVEFDITPFMDLLGVYGAAKHKFIVKVGDKNGTVTETLVLITE